MTPPAPTPEQPKHRADGPAVAAPTGDDLVAHFSECDCHDSWDQCPCASSGHPVDGSCGCCQFGIGLCGPRQGRHAAARVAEDERRAL